MLSGFKSISVEVGRPSLSLVCVLRVCCNWDCIEHGRDSEQMDPDPSLAIGQITVEVDQLAVDAFHNLVLLSVEVALSMDY